jgi:hypothetical protein
VSNNQSSPTPLPSNRSFGRLFVVVFALIGLWSLWRGGDTYLWWFGAAAIVLIVTLAVPDVLAPFNRAWMKLGELLGRIVSPVVLGFIFFLVITPFGVVKRLTGWDPMRRRFERDTTSYWIERDPPGPDPDSLPNQF